jgi:hypothetical protein
MESVLPGVAKYGFSLLAVATLTPAFLHRPCPCVSEFPFREGVARNDGVVQR